MLLLIGIPCFFLEISIGQYAGMGPVTVYSNMAPLFKGLGFANFLASCFVGLYYNMIIAWTIYYMFASFTSHLPWSDCGNEFNTEFCFSITDYTNCTAMRKNNSDYKGAIYHMGKCINNEEDMDKIWNNLTHFYACEQTIETYNVDGDKCSGVKNSSKIPGVFINNKECVDPDRADEITKLFDIPSKIRKTAAEEYLTKSVLKQSSGIDDMGPVDWALCLCLLAAWIIIFLCLIKGRAFIFRFTMLMLTLNLL